MPTSSENHTFWEEPTEDSGFQMPFHHLLEEQIKPQWRGFLRENLWAFQVLRSIYFSVQSLPFPVLDWALRGEAQSLSQLWKNLDLAEQKKLWKSLTQLLREDAERIAEGSLSLSVLRPEGLRKNLKRYPKILFNGFQLARTRLLQKGFKYAEEGADFLGEVPDYFQQNYRYQTGGHLSNLSAELYDQQMDLLFHGAADAMRRLAIIPLREHFGKFSGDGLHFLELGAGTGRLAGFVKLCFPKARVTLMDLSSPYLQKAQKDLAKFSKLNFVQGDGAHIPFPKKTFDAVYSTFLFHELPLSVRRATFSEMFRVLKPGGLAIAVDGVQDADPGNYRSILNRFPVDYEEEFYRNYAQNPLEGLMQFAGGQNVKSQVSFLAKLVWSQKAEGQ